MMISSCSTQSNYSALCQTQLQDLFAGLLSRQELSLVYVKGDFAAFFSAFIFSHHHHISLSFSVFSISSQHNRELVLMLKLPLKNVFSTMEKLTTRIINTGVGCAECAAFCLLLFDSLSLFFFCEVLMRACRAIADHQHNLLNDLFQWT